MMFGRSSTFLWRFLLSYNIWILLIFLVRRTWTVEKLVVGRSMNVFGRYAYFSVSMKVVGRNETSKQWLFREPLVDVFHNITGATSCFQNPPHPLGGGKPGEFHLEFCENLQQLLQAYFRDMSIEGMEEPWRAFTSSWSEATIAKNFGLNVDYLRGARSYILVRALRRRECVFLDNPLEGSSAVPLPHVQALAQQVRVGNTDSILKFIKTYGSHYIASFSTGNSLYQVFVFETPVFLGIRSRLQGSGLASLTKDEINSIFSPWYAEQIGNVMTASGNTSVSQWANKVLISRIHGYPFASLMKMYGNTKRIKQLYELLGNEALLSMDLKVLSPAFTDPTVKLWFLEFLLNNMQLWEQNMYSFTGK